MVWRILADRIDQEVTSTTIIAQKELPAQLFIFYSGGGVPGLIPPEILIAAERMGFLDEMAPPRFLLRQTSSHGRIGRFLKRDPSLLHRSPDESLHIRR